VQTEACDCQKLKFKGNGHLEAGEIDEAISSYSKALETGLARQEGNILLMRSLAYMKRATRQKQELKEDVNALTQLVPSLSMLRALFEAGQTDSVLLNSILAQIIDYTNRQSQIYRKAQYQHGMFQYTLLLASQDALRSTMLLPEYPLSWSRAAEIFSELWKLKESALLYEKVMELDPSSCDALRPVLQKVRKRQDLLSTARAYGCSEEILRIALDVAR